MRGRTSHRGAAPTTSAAVASTSSKRDPASASEESGDEEVKPKPSRFPRKPLPRESAEPSSSSESESDSDGLAERERELERVLADVPFGELQRARADGSLAARGGSAAAAAQKKARRESRKRPMEISTNVRPPRLREVIQVPKKVVRDPRFEPVYGDVDKEGLINFAGMQFQEKIQFLI